MDGIWYGCLSRCCRDADSGVVGPVVAAVGTPAFSGIDGDAQEVGQDRGWQISGEGQQRDILCRTYVDASFAERQTQRGGGEMATGALALEDPRVVVVESGWGDV